MKKLVLALAAASALTSAAFAQNTSNADLIINGEITEASCSMKIKPIDFQSLSIREFTNKNESGWESSAIEFSNCELLGTAAGGGDVKAVDIRINGGTPDAAKTDLWANSGTAGGLAIELEVNGSEVKPAGDTLIDLPLLGDRKVGVRARLVKSGTVTPGEINVAIGVTADYK